MSPCTRPSELLPYVQALRGQEFLKFSVSYGDELHLHLGKPQNYRSRLLQHLTKGSVTVGTRASNWLLVSPSSGSAVFSDDAAERQRDTLIATIFSYDDPGDFGKPTQCTGEDLERLRFVEQGAKVVDAHLIALPQKRHRGCGLFVRFADESMFAILPGHGDDSDEGEPLADWEIALPNDAFLSVGPGHHWAYSDGQQKRCG